MPVRGSPVVRSDHDRSNGRHPVRSSHCFSITSVAGVPPVIGPLASRDGRAAAGGQGFAGPREVGKAGGVRVVGHRVRGGPRQHLEVPVPVLQEWRR